MKIRFGILLALACAMSLTSCGGASPAAEAPVASTVSKRSGELVASDYHDVLQRIYVAYFGRPADVNGLKFFAAFLNEHALPLTVNGIIADYASNGAVRGFIDALSNSVESTALYPGDNGEFVDAIYQNLYNRQPDAAGKAFWVNALDKNVMNRASAALWIMGGAQSSDLASINNKVAVAKAFTTMLEAMDFARAYQDEMPAAVMRSVLSTVGQDTDAANFPVRDTIYRLTHLCTFTNCEFSMLIPFAHGYWDDDTDMSLVSVGTGRIYGSSPAGRAYLAANLTDSVVWWKGERLYRQYLFGWRPYPPSILSSLTLADACGRSAAGVGVAEPSYLFFGAKGPDNECHTADDMVHAVRVDMPATTAPLTVNEPVHAIHNAGGALTGFLVRNGQRIERVDASFANPSTMFTLAGTDLATLAHAGEQENTWIFTSAGKVYAFDSTGNAGAPAQVVALASGETSGQAMSTDTEDVFIAIRSGTASMRVERYNLVTRSVSTTGSAGYGSMHLTPTRVLLLDPASGAVSALPRAGGQAQEILAGSPQASGGSVTVVGERVWLHYPSGQKVASVMSDGSAALHFPGAAQAGCIDACGSIMLVEGNHLKAFDGRSGALLTDHGSLHTKHAGKHNLFTLTPQIVNGRGGVLTVMEQEQFRNFPLSSYLFVAGQTGLIPLTVQ